MKPALFLELFHRTGLAALVRRLLTGGRGRFVLELHGVAQRRYQELAPALQPSFTVEDLRALLAWLDGRFPCLTPDEFLRGGARGVLLTFDDGYANNASNVAPLLEEYQVPAVFFVTTQHVADPRNWLPSIRRTLHDHELSDPSDPSYPSDKILHDLLDGTSEDELRTVAGNPYVTLGSHTVTHPFLTRCEDRSLSTELADSKRFLEGVTGRPVDLFAYPTGDYDQRVAKAVRDAGYRAAFVEVSRNLGLNQWEIPRIGLYSASPAYLAAKLCGLHQHPLRQSFG